MTKKTTIKWRLGKLPTPDELVSLTKAGLIKEEEARNILFTEDTTDTENLKSEIEFLRKLVERLSNSSKIIESIRYIEKPYYQYPWYVGYNTWCSNLSDAAYGGTNNLSITNGTSNNLSALASGTSSTSINTQMQSNLASTNLLTQSFTNIKTF